MKLVVIDDDGRQVINTTLILASPYPDPAYKFSEAHDLDYPGQDLNHLVSLLQLAINYLGTTCLIRLVTRLNSQILHPWQRRNLMDEQGLANDLMGAIDNVNNAYKRVQPYSHEGAKALAEISHHLNHAYSKIRDGDASGFSGLPHKPFAVQKEVRAEIPQPKGLQGTFFRQRPKESWNQTAIRVFSEDGHHSLIELSETNDAAARNAAAQAIRIRKAVEVMDIKSLETISGAHLVGEPEEPRRKAHSAFDFAPMRPVRAQQPPPPIQTSGFLSPPLRADAEPFTPGGMFAALDGNHAFGNLQPPRPAQIRPPPGLQAFQSRFSPQERETREPLPKFVADPRPNLREQPAPKLSPFAPIGHERKRLFKVSESPTPQLKQFKLQDQASLPDNWEDVASLEDDSEHTFESSHPQQSYDGEILTPRASEAPERSQSPQFETSPGSPTYKSWAQKAAVGDDESGWEEVTKGTKGKKGIPAHTPQRVVPAVINHQHARYVHVSGCRASITLSDITAQIDTGPLVSISLIKEPNGGLGAEILFCHGSHAIDFVSNNQYSLSAHGQSLYGAGVTVVMGSGYGGNAAELRGMIISLNQSGRSDAGAHFQRRRLTFSGSGLALTEAKLRTTFTKVVGIEPSEVELIIVFNPGNATAIFANVFVARKVRDQMCSKRNGEWKHAKIMYSSDPCEKHLDFMDKTRSEKQADRADVVRRAYQKAGKVNC